MAGKIPAIIGNTSFLCKNSRQGPIASFFIYKRVEHLQVGEMGPERFSKGQPTMTCIP
jgi:hypothetical protein